MSTGKSAKVISRRKKTTTKAAKKTAAPKKVAAKKTTKKTVGKKAPNAAVSKQKATSALKTETQSKKIADRVTLAAGSSLMVLSPFRFPLDVDKIAINTARFGGAFLVVAGAILTLWHSTAVFAHLPPLNLVAQTASSTEEEPPPAEDPGGGAPEDPEENLLSDMSVPFDFTPRNPIAGDDVRVQVQLPDGLEHAELFARNLQTNEVIEFGSVDIDDERAVDDVIDVTFAPDGNYEFFLAAIYFDEWFGDYSVTVTDTSNQTVVNATSGTNEPEPEEETTEESDEEADPGTEEPTGETEVAHESDEDEHVGEDIPETDPDEFIDIIQEEPFEDDDVIDPEIRIELPHDVLSDSTAVAIRVNNSSYIELYVLQENTGTQRYLGQPRQISADTWRLLFDSTNLPNGNYRIVASVRTPYGFFTKKSEDFSVYNETEVSPDPRQLDYQESVWDVAEKALVDTTVIGEPEEVVPTAEERVDALLAPHHTEDDLDTEIDALKDEYEALVSDVESEIEKALQILATAHRSHDEHQVDVATDRVKALYEELSTDSAEISDFVEQQVDELLVRVKNDVERTDRIIVERTGKAAELDTDRDGITDFDEVVIYQTDPEIADSDGDGFTDGAEVLSGFNPTDSSTEAPIAYESPQESGVVREDLLVVESIATENANTEDGTVEPVAILTGKGLPNSYVTLYIFSTPIIVTVRTEADGSWLYRFDKELEDGEHQVYVGITDNAGKLVAKSNPLPFIKEAQAFSPVEAPAPGTVTTNSAPVDGETQSVISLVLVVASISVVGIGLVLLLIGVYMDGSSRRQKLEAIEPAA